MLFSTVESQSMKGHYLNKFKKYILYSILHFTLTINTSGVCVYEEHFARKLVDSRTALLSPVLIIH